MKAKFMTFAIMMAMLGVVSCSKTDLYDESAIDDLKAAEAAAKDAKLIEDYKANFIKTYGEINPDQSWDFSTNDEIFFTGSSATRAFNGFSFAPGAKAVSVSNDYYQIPDVTMSLMNTVFLEGHDNTQNFMKGTFFDMIVPENDFTILPIYMGQSGGNFALYLHVDGVQNDIKVWSKWDGIQYKMENDNKWNKLDKNHNNNGYNTVNAKAIQAKPITISVSNFPKNAKMQFYLKITEAASGYNHINDKLGCVNGYIKEYAYTATQVELDKLPGVNPNEKVECKFFGCEDASTSKTDKDYNDVVFLCYGQPHVPQSYEVKDLSKTVTKRYMIEDLGESNDTDFNDIVVDVIQTYTATIKTYEDGTPLSGYENPEWQYVSSKAAIRALGGILDFELKIGSTKWKKSDTFTKFSQMMNTTDPSNDLAPLHVIENIQGYNPGSNNISVTVFKDKVNTVVNFPETGAVPMIIATDSNILWSKERVGFDFKKFEQVTE